MKKLIVFLVFSLGLFCTDLNAATSQKPYTVSIIQIVEHPALDAVRRGAIAAIEESHLKDKVAFEYLNAQGNMVTLSQIAKKTLGKKPNAILAIGTPAAQAAVSRNTQIPVIFSPITDPVAAKLVNSLEHPGGVATGTSDLSPIKQQLELIIKILPQAKKIAILYNPGEANSIALVKIFKSSCKELRLQAEEGIVQNSSMVYSSAISMKAKGVHAIYIPTDNTVVSALEAVIKAGFTTKIPVFSADSEGVEKGSLASIAINYQKLGKTTGEMLTKVLEKKSPPATMPVQYQDQFELHTNTKTAEKLGVIFPDVLLKEAIKHP